MAGARAVAAFVVLVGLAPRARATQVVAVPLAQMAREAEVIIHARVGAQEVRWNDKHTRPLTLTDVEVLAGLKGARQGEVLRIYQVGGTVDGRTLGILGAVQLRVGEEIVFFGMRYLDPQLGPLLVSYGVGLGKYDVHRRGDLAIAAPAFGDVAFVERDAQGRLQPVGPPAATAEPLAQLMERIRKLVGGAR